MGAIEHTNLNAAVNAVAKQSMETACDDLPSLVALRDNLDALTVHDAHVRATDAIDDAIQLLDQIVLAEVDDAAAALESVHALIDQIQDRIDGGAAEGTRNTASDEPEVELDPDLLAAWLSASVDAAAEIESLVLDWHSDGDAEAIVPEVRRRVHTVKGECGVVGAHGAQRLFHDAESAIDRGIEQDQFPGDALLAAVDWFRGLIDRIENGGAPTELPADALLRTITAFPAHPPADTNGSDLDEQPDGNDHPSQAELEAQLAVEVDETVTEFISESSEHITNAERALLELESSPDDASHIDTVFRAFHTIKGVAGYLNLTPIVTLAHKAEHVLDLARKGKRDVDATLLEVSLAACDVLTVLIGAIDGSATANAAAFSTLLSRIDDVENGCAPQTAPRAETASAQRPPIDAPPTAAAKRSRAQIEQTAKVSTLRLDSLVDLVGELVIGHQMVVQDPEVLGLQHQQTQRNIVHVGKIIRDLQGVAMSLRMVTLRGTFQKMSRLARDLSSKSDKPVRLVVEGEDTELDRSVVEELGDPLVHLIRNACDHGVESAADRVSAGKPEVGTVTLRAFHKGGSIVIEIEDDGRGLDREKLIAKALERGVLTSDRDPAELTDAEVFQFIFAAGFSTAAQVTDVSGRGVGMDVVRRNIESLRGKVEISSTRGVGTTFRLSLPLTLAIIDGMVVRVGLQRYVIPTLSIEQSFRPRPEQLHTVDGGRGEMAMVRDALLPIHRLDAIFDAGAETRALADGLLLAVEAKGERACLAVDEILGQQQVVIKSLGDGLGTMPGISGGAILGDGRIAPILDIGVLLDAIQTIAAEATGVAS